MNSRPSASNLAPACGRRASACCGSTPRPPCAHFGPGTGLVRAISPPRRWSNRRDSLPGRPGAYGHIAGCVMAQRGLELGKSSMPFRCPGTQLPETEAQRFVEEFERPYEAKEPGIDRITVALARCSEAPSVTPWDTLSSSSPCRRFTTSMGPMGPDYALLGSRATFCALYRTYPNGRMRVAGFLEGRIDGDSLMGRAPDRRTLRQLVDEPQGGHRAPNAVSTDAQPSAAVHWSQAGGPTAGGCGSVMRVPFGLVFADDLELAERGRCHSYLTHGDRSPRLRVAMAVGVGLALQGGTLGYSAPMVQASLPNHRRHDVRGHR